MRSMARYIQTYYYETDKRVFILTSVFTAFIIFLNYHWRLEESIQKFSFSFKLIGSYLVFATAFVVPYFLYYRFRRATYFSEKRFRILLFSSPLVFALKVSFDPQFPFSKEPLWNNYWNHIVYWPLLVLLVLFLLLVYWYFLDRELQPFYGCRVKQVNWKPYWMMLILMAPLIAAAATSREFQSVYPKMQSVEDLRGMDVLRWPHKLLFELSYGTDFISIEFFFRAFLILAFIRYAGKDSILAMACFYCTIHFGKPMPECISSYFGGMILGIIIYHTRSVFGGLLVHLGIAWMMEWAGWLAQ